MAAINDLLQQIPDLALRNRLEQEFARLSKNRKFGLVFEEHIPECTPLYGVAIRRGSTVSRKSGQIGSLYTVVKIDENTALCRSKMAGTIEEIPVSELVTIAQFGEPIFPALEPIGLVENAPNNSLWHTIIEADNYHALQLLEYLYPKQVDCIYIDPPYNTGARDWKYNNDYVDDTDSWRHSKWLSMMQKRLKIAKRILADDGAIFISIDDNEQPHLRLLCDEVFGADSFYTQIIIQSNVRGHTYRQIAKTHEYILVYTKTPATVFNEITKSGDHDDLNLSDSLGNYNIRELRNRNPKFGRRNRPNLFYAFYVNPCVVDKDGFNPVSLIKTGDFSIEVLPLNSKGNESCWRWGTPRSGENISTDTQQSNLVAKSVRTGGYNIYEKYRKSTYKAKTIWLETEMTTERGTVELGAFGLSEKFAFPKPTALVCKILQLSTKEDSLIVDFFAGSGTTLNAVNLLNVKDGGNRRCILVTNNEVSESESKLLQKSGFSPGDPEWEAHGICREVTWPRTVFSILGEKLNGLPIKGEYLSDAEGSKRLMSEGFPANVEYFKLGFLDRNAVSLGRQFREVLPLLWLKAGAVGKRPEIDFDGEPTYLILPKNNFAILVDETEYSEFSKKLLEENGIESVYFVTNSEEAFREMSAGIKTELTYQLYRDYIDNFVLGARRTSL